jgi:hypothetical protein
MSDQRETGVLSLEDLFLSREFGKPRAATLASTETLFGNGSSRGPLVPLTAGAASSFGHLTTTHLRRNRSLFAAVSGAAAALLVAVGVLAQTHAPTKQNGLAAGVGGTGTAGTGTPPVPTTFPLPNPVTSTTSTSGTVAPGGAVGLAAFVSGSGGPVVSVHTSVPKPVTNPSTINPINPTGPTPGKPATPTPAPTSGNVLTPVVTLVGHAVTTVGATATVASSGLGVTLPPITPLTHLVGSLGGTLSNLGDSLSGTTV